MKHKIIFILLIFLFTGCYNYRELNNLAITSAVGIDKKDGKYYVTTQVINTQKMGSDSTSIGSQSKFVLYETSGDTLQEAFRQIVLESPKRIYANHLQLIIVGEEVAKEGVSQIFDFFMRNPESRKQYQMIIARDTTANNILKVLTPLETLSSKNMLDSIQADSKYLGVSEKITFEDQVKTYLNNKIDMFATTIIIEGNLEEGKNTDILKESNPSTKLKINNLAVFREDKLQGYLTEKESIAASFLNNTITNTIITFKCDENKYISTEIMNPKTDFEFEKDKLKVKIKVSAEGNINEVDCDLKISEPKVISDIERMTQEQIKQSIIETINKVNKEYKSDTFGFLDKIYKSNPKYSYKIQDNWFNENLQKLDVQVDVNVSLKGKGNIIMVVPNEEN